MPKYHKLWEIDPHLGSNVFFTESIWNVEKWKDLYNSSLKTLLIRQNYNS